jgi:hypothetical protein
LGFRDRIHKIMTLRQSFRPVPTHDRLNPLRSSNGGRIFVVNLDFGS